MIRRWAEGGPARAGVRGRRGVSDQDLAAWRPLAPAGSRNDQKAARKTARNEHQPPENDQKTARKPAEAKANPPLCPTLPPNASPEVLPGDGFLLLPNSTGRSPGSTSWPGPSRLRLPRSSSTSNWSGNPPSPSRRSPALPRNRGSRPLGGLLRTASFGSDGCFAPRCGAPGSSLRPIAPALSLTATHSSHSKRSSRPPMKISPRPWPLGRRCGSRIWPTDRLTGMKSRCPTEHPFLRHCDACTAFCGTPPI